MEIRSNTDVHNEYPWLTKRVPTGFWSSIENQRRYIEWLGKKLGYQNYQDWYKVEGSDFKKNGGAGLLFSYYNDSQFLILKTLIPEYDWKPWLFGRIHYGFWTNVENQRIYIRWLGEQLGYKKTEDWYRVKHSDFKKNGGAGLLVTYYNDSPFLMLSTLLPDFDWKPWLFGQIRSGYWKKLKINEFIWSGL
jgi:hypothetical protein